MKERPILFSTEMVQAILEGRKSQTRRVIKIPNGIRRSSIGDSIYEGEIDGLHQWYDSRGGNVFGFLCPYGQPGDGLWVRETWGVCQLDGPDHITKEYPNVLYRTDSSTRLILCDGVWKYANDKFKWRPSIFMPRWASRITLEVVNVRVERVRDITEDDALAEGCVGSPCGCDRYMCTDCMNTGWIEPPTLDYMFLWNKINAKRGYGWDVNPWVWVVEFRKVE